MATSGSVNFSTSRDTLIAQALQNVGAIGEGITPSATQLSEAAVVLNMIVKAWQADGLPLWALKRGYIFPVSDTNEILLGPTSGHAATSFAQTTTSAASSSGASTITVTSTTGIATTYAIGVEQDDGSIHWTTVNGAPSGSTVTLTAVLTDDVASGNMVYCYNTANRITRPLQIIQAFTHDYVSGTDIPVSIISKAEYDDLGTKTTESYPTQIAYDPVLTDGTLYIYPRFQNGDKIITVRYHRPYEDFDAGADEPDFPQEWYLALLWYLSWALAPRFGVDKSTRTLWLQEAIMLKEEALNFSQENASVYFGISSRYK